MEELCFDLCFDASLDDAKTLRNLIANAVLDDSLKEYLVKQFDCAIDAPAPRRELPPKEWEKW